MGTLQAIAVTVVAEHKASVWRIGWDMNLLAAAYAVSSRTALTNPTNLYRHNNMISNQYENFIFNVKVP